MLDMNQNRNSVRRALLLLLCTVLALSFTGCMTEGGDGDVPQIPERLSRNEDGVPTLNVYNTANDTVEEMDVESYLMGVVAGEMKNTWPIEALKAQAILARTFTMKFLTTKTSGYEGADISTDVQEAMGRNTFSAFSKDALTWGAFETRKEGDWNVFKGSSGTYFVYFVGLNEHTLRYNNVTNQLRTDWYDGVTDAAIAVCNYDESAAMNASVDRVLNTSRSN